MRSTTPPRTRFAGGFGATWLLAACLLATGACLPTPQLGAETAPAPAAWQRLVVLGASASVGFGTETAGERPIGLAAILDAALLGEHEAPVAHATDLFFLNPGDWSQTLLDQALEEEPSGVIALDYLFWFVYGRKESEDERLVELEDGLEKLARFQCPLVLGEIPDMSAAVGKMLAASQVPAPETLEAVNRRLRAWAAARPGTSLLVLAPREGEGLIQPDDLHPTVRGLAEIAIEALRALPGGADAAANDAVLTDPVLLADLVRN